MTYAEGMGEEQEAVGDPEDPQGMLPISPTLVVEEINSAIRLLQKHKGRFEAMQSGNLPEPRVASTVVEAVGELLYTSAKLESLARTLNGESRG